MSIKSLVIAPHLVYLQKSETITEINNEIKQLAQDLIDTVYANKGIGMAATQIGILKRMIVVDISYDINNPATRNPLVMINPEIIAKSSELFEYNEGSISFPGIYVTTKRPVQITVSYLDLDGIQQTLEARELLSTCIQHEIEYTLGKSFIDHVSKTKKAILLEKLIKMKKS